MIVNLVVNKSHVKIPSSRISRIIEGQEKPKLEQLPEAESTCSLLANLHCSRGESGKVGGIYYQFSISFSFGAEMFLVC